MTTQTITLSKLIPSPVNVRKTGGQSIDDLTASIEAHGLIQSLTVKLAAKGRFEVVAGGRRLAALNRLMKEGRSANSVAVTKDFPVSCRVLDGENATEISLAENAIRQAMHPADQFDAFQALADQNQTPTDIAARFGVEAKFVEQRLKLARVSPKLMKAYRDGDMPLDQLEAFTISNDHKKQEAVWKSVQKEYYRSASVIRDRLSEKKPSLGRGTARLITAEEYEAAGGTITRDLFSEKDEGWFDDPDLLERLIVAKLEAVAEQLRNEGWAWVVVFPGGFNRWQHGYDIHPDVDDLPEAAEIPAAIKAISGCAIFPTWQGTIETEVALIQDSDEADDAENSGVVAPLPPSKLEAPTVKPEYSASLLAELTAHRTQAMRVAMANDAPVALDTLVWTLALREFGHGSGDQFVAKITLDRTYPGMHGLMDTQAAQEMSDIRDRWGDTIPAARDDLWRWVRNADQSTKLDLLAFLVATSLNAVQERGNPAISNSHQVHEALGLNMADWWTPTVDGYLSRVSKDKVLEALTEANVPEQPAPGMLPYASLKKKLLTELAEKALEGKRWLPKPLRAPEPEAQVKPTTKKKAA